MIDDEDDVLVLIGKKISEYLSRNTALVPTMEKISISILVTGLILNIIEVQNTRIVLLTGSILTAITYFLSTLQRMEPGDIESAGTASPVGFINFSYKLYYFALSVTALTILGFVIDLRSLLKVMTISSLITLAMALIISIIIKIEDRSGIWNSVFYIRMVPAILLLIYIITIHYHPQVLVVQNYKNGVAKFRSHDYAGAIEDFSNEIKRNPHNAKAYYVRGRSKDYSSNDTGAMADYTRAIALDPDLAEAYLRRGLHKYYGGDYEGAVYDLNMAENDPDSKLFYFLRLKRAKEKYALGDILDFPYSARANARYRVGDYKGAIEDYQHAIQLNSSDFDSHINSASARSKLGDYAGAITDLTEAAKYVPDIKEQAQLFYEIADLKVYTGDYSGAKTDFSRVIQINPDSAQAYYGRGMAEYKLGDRKEACLDWRKSSELGSREASEAIKKYCR